MLEGFGQFCAEFIVPLSAIDDKVGTHFDDEKVVMPEPFEQAFILLRWAGNLDDRFWLPKLG